MPPSTKKLIFLPAQMIMGKSSAERHRLIYQYSNIAPRRSGKNCKYFKFLSSLNFQKRLGYKENNTKYRSLPWKHRGHVRILICRTWPTDIIYFKGGLYCNYFLVVFWWTLRSLTPMLFRKRKKHCELYLLSVHAFNYATQSLNQLTWPKKTKHMA